MAPKMQNKPKLIMLYHTAIWEQSLVSLTITLWQKQVLKQMGLALGTNEVQNKKIVGMWLVGQFNVSGRARPTFIEEPGALY